VSDKEAKINSLAYPTRIDEIVTKTLNVNY